MVKRARYAFLFLFGFIIGVLFSYTSRPILMRSTILKRDGIVVETASFRNKTDFLEDKAEGFILRKTTAALNQLSFNDSRFHGDDTTVADILFQNIKILCLVMTYPENQKKAIHVNATWGKRCNKLLFVTRNADEKLPTLIVNVTDGRSKLGEKTRDAFDHAYKHYLADYDWFLKGDDDTYVIMENLRYFLSAKDCNSPVFFGQTFSKFAGQRYASGGAGYIASREALRRFGQRSNQTQGCKFNYGSEDVDFGRCMASLGVKLGNSLDALGRTRFHCFSAKHYIDGKFQDLYDQHNRTKTGAGALSDYAISFHYVAPDDMYLMEYFIYHLNPYGIIKGLQNLNSMRRRSDTGQHV